MARAINVIFLKNQQVPLALRSCIRWYFNCLSLSFTNSYWVAFGVYNLKRTNHLRPCHGGTILRPQSRSFSLTGSEGSHPATFLSNFYVTFLILSLRGISDIPYPCSIPNTSSLSCTSLSILVFVHMCIQLALVIVLNLCRNDLIRPFPLLKVDPKYIDTLKY